ncbi:unnamed protein product [Oikopleura dioica]|uniref:N-acetyltransferase domain-containing protein n=1 Tax=Oikopleura dioica TaxID=34765 RepID=E4X1X6_OIKDI|nr:unnamed protein product [Oikopleura dioica]
MPIILPDVNISSESSISSCDNVELVYKIDGNIRELIAVATRDIGTYSENIDFYKKNIEKNYGENFVATMKFLIELGDINAEQHEITPNSRIYTNGVTCVSSSMRGKRIGSTLIKNAVEFAKQSGADFFAVQCINNISKRIYEKEGFTIAKTIFFEDYFKNDKKKLGRIDQAHPAAFYMIKKLQ